MTESTHTNRLIHETSPYLLQHAHNPVDWYAWGEDAFTRSQKENKPIFLSIGYSACHWCHVMERESFENDAIAEILNREFISIKVDREERPDVDSIYMQAVQIMTGHGGWPMSMFLTPAGTPYYAGTYFPPEDGRGMPGFRRVLLHVAEAYKTRTKDVEEAGKEIQEALEKSIGAAPAGRAPELNDRFFESASARLVTSYDPTHGGFGGAPKFPPSMTLEFLMQRAHANGDENIRNIVTHTLTKMARGGIYDQVGGGFHRYSVDARWLAPHFEKMLYDNALLARLYVRAWQWTKDPFYKQIAREILGFVTREMTSPEGGFYSTLDADSEGEEGKFYVWDRSEIMEVLGPVEGRVFCALYDVSERGNWEGKNILNVPRDLETVAADLGVSYEQISEIASRGKCKLYGKRSDRIRPARDEKILAGWNGWMLTAFAEAAVAFQADDLLEVVKRNAAFLSNSMRRDGKLFRSFKDGVVKIGGLLEDYSGVSWGLMSAFEATQDLKLLETARELTDEILARFPDDERGGFFDTPADHEQLIVRPKDLLDNATPAGNSVTAEVLFKLAIYFGEKKYHDEGTRAVAAASGLMAQYPSAFGFLLGAAGFQAGQPKEIVVTGNKEDEGLRALLRVVGEEYVPHRVLVTSSADGLPLLEHRDPEKVAAYVCRGYHCLEPTHDAERFRELLKSDDPSTHVRE